MGCSVVCIEQGRRTLEESLKEELWSWGRGGRMVFRSAGVRGLSTGWGGWWPRKWQIVDVVVGGLGRQQTLTCVGSNVVLGP